MLGQGYTYVTIQGKYPTARHHIGWMVFMQTVHIVCIKVTFGPFIAKIWLFSELDFHVEEHSEKHPLC